MSQYPIRSRQALAALSGLDFGLRVHVQLRPGQRAILAGPENTSLQELTSELAELISSLRVYSYAFRGHLEQVTSALQLNVACASWRYARRAALDLAGILAQAQKRRLVKSSLAVEGTHRAFHIAELCAREVR